MPWPAHGLSHPPAPPLVPWPGVRQGARVAVAGAPFGVLSPLHFSSFLTLGVVSATLSAAAGGGGGRSNGSGCSPAGSSSGGSGCTALALVDAHCLPGMEGGPVFMAGLARADAPSAAAAAAGPAQAPFRWLLGGEEWLLAGMLLPPLKAPVAHVEVSLVAPLAAVLHAAAVAAAAGAAAAPARGLAGCSGGTSSSSGVVASRGAAEASAVACSPPPRAQRPAAGLVPASASAPVPLPDLPRPAAGARLPPVGPAAGAGAAQHMGPAALAEVLAGVVAVEAGGAWASGVVVSGAGHILTNAHLLHPPPAAGVGAPAGGAAAGPGQPAQHLAAGSTGSSSSTTAISTAAYPPVRVLLGTSGSAGGLDSHLRQWWPAEVLHVFSPPLDLAVLQLWLMPGVGASASAGRTRDPGTPHVALHGDVSAPWQPPQQQRQQHYQPAVPRPLRLSTRPPCSGQQVCVAGWLPCAHAAPEGCSHH